MNSETLRRRSALIQTIARAAFAGVQWREVFSGVMSEQNINPQEVEEEIAQKHKKGFGRFTPEEVSKLDDYINEWIDIVKDTDPSATAPQELTNRIQPIVNSVYKDIFNISSPPTIVLCQSPAKFATYLKVLIEEKGESAIYSSAEYQKLARQVLSDFTADEQKRFLAPLKNEFSQLTTKQGSLLRGKALNYRMLEHAMQELYGEVKNQTTTILGTDASDYFDEGWYYRFEAIRRRLGTIFDIDFHFAGPESNPFWRGLERLMSPTSSFNRETWGFWQGYFILGAGFLMEHMSERGTYTESCKRELQQWLRLFKLAPWYSFFENVCLVGMYPVELFLDEQLRLSNRSGAAVTFADGWRLWAIEGNRVPRRLIEEPDSITIDEIKEADNVHIRRIMIEIYGTSRYLEDSDSRMIHEDEYGQLYQREIPGDEPITMVCVKNSTMEADGTFRRYFLRVPPDMTTAKEAVAWTFGMQSEEYNPDVET